MSAGGAFAATRIALPATSDRALVPRPSVRLSGAPSAGSGGAAAAPASASVRPITTRWISLVPSKIV